MLSYRHAFHAGNHADVLKHLILVQIIDYMNQKETPFWVIDTHAGAGIYSLDSGYATKLSEYINGIGLIWQRKDLPESLDGYINLVRSLNPDGILRHYPGSPCLAWNTIRNQDRLRLFERHSSDNQQLRNHFRTAGRRVSIQDGDGFAGLKAILPPPPRRALVLIDPSYEEKQDYRRVADSLADAMKRFPTGVYVLWYPQLSRPESKKLPDILKALPSRQWLHATLSISKPSQNGLGMYGSGMFIINPPWHLHGTLCQTLPWLVNVLGKDDGAVFTLEHSERNAPRSIANPHI